MLKIIKAHAVKNLCYISAQPMTPKGIVVHTTGANNPNLKRYVDAPDEVGVNRFRNHWNVARPGGVKKCVHAFIGYDKNGQVRVAEILPLDICGWGVGKGKKGSYNSNPAYIQFEICESNLDDSTYYQQVFQVAAEYCAELCQTFGISVSNIVGHCEAYRQGYGSNHADPEHWMKKHKESMSDFRARVFALLEDAPKQTAEQAMDKAASATVPEVKTECPYLVKITTDCLYIRKGAGTNTAKVGVITDRGVYTIVEEKSDKSGGKWGKLKSGAGWISLNYTRRI